MEVTEDLLRQTASARLHNIDAEEIMGMFSAGKEKSKHAGIDFLRSRIRSKKNGVLPFLDSLSKDERERVINWAVRKARKNRKTTKKKVAEVKQELSRRALLKIQKKEEKNRKELELKIKNTDVKDLKSSFPDLDEDMLSHLCDILTGRAVGRSINHTWYNADTGEKVVYLGKIEKRKKKKREVHSYTVAYWKDIERYEDAVDYIMSKFQIGADLICEDLVLC